MHVHVQSEIYDIEHDYENEQTLLTERNPPPIASNLNQKWSSGIPIQISGLIRIRITMSAGSISKCCGFITLSASVISPSVVKIGRWLCAKNESHKIPYSAMAREGTQGRKRIRNWITTEC